jgi:formamidopyrimidine-DNA glycosylase
MPELPEVETIVKGLSKRLAGLEIISGRLFCPQICENKEPVDPGILKGFRIKDVRRRGKVILIDLDGNITILFHLGMTGQLFFSLPRDSLDRHTHFVLRFSRSPQELRFRDVRRFGYLAFLKTDDIVLNQRLDRLGPEPLEMTFSVFVSLFQGRRARVKSLLMDQHFIAGIGNIYADEILFRAKLHPSLSVSLLETSHLRRLWRAMRDVLEQAIKYKGSTIRTYINAETHPGQFQSFHRVYGRETQPCWVCRTLIERMKMNGRSTYFCPHCQELW